MKSLAPNTIVKKLFSSTFISSDETGSLLEKTDEETFNSSILFF